MFLITFISIFGSSLIEERSDSKIGGFLQKIFNYPYIIEKNFYDYKVKEKLGQETFSKDITLISIDDHDIQELGGWPLPRSEYAKLINKLKIYGSKIIVFDLLFPEGSKKTEIIDPDQELAKAISEFRGFGGDIILSYGHTRSKNEYYKFEDWDDVLFKNRLIYNGDDHLNEIYINSKTLPNKKFLKSTSSLGHLTNFTDNYGIFRRYLMAANSEKVYLPSLALKAVQQKITKEIEIKKISDSYGVLRIGETHVETSIDGEVKMRYFGHRGAFHEISIWTILNLTDTPDHRIDLDAYYISLLKDKIVFIGPTSKLANDYKLTPIGNIPGVYVHMNAARMLLEGYYFKSFKVSLLTSLALLLFGLVVILVSTRFPKPFYTLLSITGLAAIYFLSDKFFFMEQGYEVKLIHQYFFLITCFIWHITLVSLAFSKTSFQKNFYKFLDFLLKYLRTFGIGIIVASFFIFIVMSKPARQKNLKNKKTNSFSRFLNKKK